ncbi:MAG: hypothetical protein IMW97_02315 [Firmicutes bacterium]|nr:hypothetical protein [Candidatus Fermentithermobacillaceae bacterium]
MAVITRLGAIVLISMILLLLSPSSVISPGGLPPLPEPVIPVDGTYRKAEDVYRALDKLYEAYETITPLESGLSQVKRLPIPAFRIGNGPCALLIVGGIHGDEWPVIGTVLYVAEQYARGMISGAAYETGATPPAPGAAAGNTADTPGALARDASLSRDIATVLQGRSVVVVPMLNPDGLGTSRYNGRGVDLNRNFDAGWAKAIGKKGNAPESEAESKFLADLTRRVKPDVVMAFHCFLDCVFWTYDQEGECLKRDEEVARSVIEAYGDLLHGGLQASSPTESAHGGYKDWFIKEFRRPGFTIETPGRDRFGSLENMVKSDFWPRFQEASVRAGLNAVRTFLGYAQGEGQ